jgi:hypothetical protein
MGIGAEDTRGRDVGLAMDPRAEASGDRGDGGTMGEMKDPAWMPGSDPALNVWLLETMLKFSRMLWWPCRLLSEFELLIAPDVFSADVTPDVMWGDDAMSCNSADILVTMSCAKRTKDQHQHNVRCDFYVCREGANLTAEIQGTPKVHQKPTSRDSSQ